MPKRVTKLQVFIASPGDVEAERDIAEHVVNDLNIQIASKDDGNRRTDEIGTA
jgi:hypothetical protein